MQTRSWNAASAGPGTTPPRAIRWRRYPPETPFAALPGDWRCPTCDGEKHRFLALSDSPATDANADADASPAEGLVAAYRHIAQTRMADLPVYNHRLSGEAIGFQRHGDGWLGIVVDPLVHERRTHPGPTRRLERYPRRHQSHPRPAIGRYEFVAGHIDGIGTILNCSLFSPMFEFEEQEAAIEAANAAMVALLDPEEPRTGSSTTVPPPPAEVSRRHLTCAAVLEADHGPPSPASKAD